MPDLAQAPATPGTVSSTSGLPAAGWAALALAGCGGGGGGSGGATPPPAANAAATTTEATRFLAHAGLGTSLEQLQAVRTVGYAGWLDAQEGITPTQGHHAWMVEQGYAVDANINSFAGCDNTLWRKFLSSPDVLRQRMVLALSEVFVVSMAGLPVSWRGLILAHYVDVLEAHAFGNYRALLEAVTLSPAMGVYLNMRGNQKANTSTGRVPDENYAREVLQLFSIGLVELNTDGSLKDGRATDTYGQDTITGLAQVFTGWDFDGFSRTDFAWTSRPMAHIASRHSPGEKRFLGTTIAAGTPGPQALQQALDAIANHPNVGPFFGRQLIQRLVCSQPSAAYVGRVAAVFNNNGQGVRGDLKAVLRAVLLDTEARSAPSAAQTTRGKLREPVLRFIEWARSFKASSASNRWTVGNLSDPSTRLGQSPLRAPSVFNFFRPGYVPPNSALASQGITAPEFQITNETSVVGWANFAQSFVANGVGDVTPDYTPELALAADAAALVRHIIERLAANALSTDSEALIAQAVGSMAASTDAGKLNRVRAAIHLVLCSPEYLVQV